MRKYPPRTIQLTIFGQPALDINAPLLALAALHCMNDTSDPFFTSLKAGEYDARRPSGQPCDAAFFCDPAHVLSKGGKIVMAVVISVVGLLILGLVTYWLYLGSMGKSA